MSTTIPFRPDRVFITGIVLLLISLAIYCYPLLIHSQGSDFDEGRFMLNYLLVIVYVGIILSSGRLKQHDDGLSLLFVLLTIALVSCYSLNREFNIFQTSSTWWAVVLVICCANYLTVPFFHRLPEPLQLLVCGVAGVSFAVFTYLAAYLIPLYPMSAIFFFALGLSLHTFVPLFFILCTIVFIRRVGKANRRLTIGFFVGLGLAIVIVLQFAVRWQIAVRDINSDYATAEAINLNSASADAITGTTGYALPSWVAVARHNSPGSITEKILKTGLVYTESPNWQFEWIPSRLFNEQRKHDPLIVIASSFSGKSDLKDEDRVKVLESMYDSRLQAQQRLWRGDELATTHISSGVELWPKLHLSYTEENITVTDNSTQKRWNDQQEAIYTFHLPEGALVSSLSLWIEGKEEKARLASRGKADSAYKTIVGVYRQDPSVVHWQEGNTVSVRVFPIRWHESRQFKIGITAPLEKEGQELVYRNIYFDGPAATDAASAIQIQPMQPLTELVKPRSFYTNATTLGYTGAYDPAWELRFHDEGVENTTFHFNGKQYATERYEPEMETVPLHQVYLDINKSWTREEFETIVTALPDSNLFAYSPETGLIPLQSDTRDAVFKTLRDQQFSLFPLSLITDRSNSLLISKSPLTSPSIADLRGSTFVQQLQNSFSPVNRVRLFHLGPQLSPYLKTLKECGAFQFESGELATLQSHIQQRKFAGNAERDGLMVIDPAGVCVRRSDWGATSASASNAVASGQSITQQGPDHLLRLFAYRSILEGLSGQLPAENPGLDGATSEALVRTAEEAHIVSPVSSLIVLERADYGRFNIAESKNSLKNATLQGNGAVPEPGEWALIIGVVFILLYIRYRNTPAKTERL